METKFAADWIYLEQFVKLKSQYIFVFSSYQFYQHFNKSSIGNPISISLDINKCFNIYLAIFEKLIQKVIEAPNIKKCYHN